MIAELDVHTLRAEVMSQPSGERLEYALGFLDMMCPAAPVWSKTATDLGLAFLTPTNARLLHRLALSAGHVVAFEVLEVAAEFHGTSGARNALKCAICRLRLGIVAAGCPIVIEAVYAHGYRLEAAPELPMPRRRP